MRRCAKFEKTGLPRQPLSYVYAHSVFAANDRVIFQMPDSQSELDPLTHLPLAAKTPGLKNFTKMLLG